MKSFQIQKLLLLCFGTLLSVQLNAQTYKVSGNTSSPDGPLPFVTILIKSAQDSSVVKFGATDTLGEFVINGIPDGNYYAEASAVGIKKYRSEGFSIAGADKKLPDFEMSYDGELDAVNIVAIRPVVEVHPDKTVFNVDNTINATGSNGFDLLRKAPGVIIDNSNNIIVEGKSGVQIYIDNKPSVLAGDDLINFLRTLQAADIDNIEIITQPSSKFDAAGGAGIINIILKRDKNLGTNGTIAAGYAYGKNHHVNGSVSLNHRNKKTNIYTAYSNGFGRNWSFFNMKRDQFGVIYDSETINNNYTGSHNARVGMDWFLNPKHTVGVLVSGNYFDSNNQGNTATAIIPDTIGTTTQRLIANNSGNGLFYQAAGNLNYQFKDTLGHEFSMDADYAVYTREQNNYQPNLYLNGMNGDTILENNYRMITPTDISIVSFKADYAQYLWNGKVSTGVKFSLVNTDNAFNFFDVGDGVEIKNDDRSNEFLYQENINAAYINYAKRLGMKWNIQAGVRVEHTRSYGELKSTQSSDEDSVRREYVNFFPSAGLTYTPGMNHMWSLTFSKRIERPNYQSLNPFVNQSTELSFIKGNPFLQPQYAYNTKLSHTFKYRFTTSLSFSYTEDYFAQVTDTLGPDKAFLTTLNVADNSTINLGLSLPFAVKPWWNVYLSVNAFYSSYIANDPKFTPLTRQTVSVFGQNSFLLKGGFKLEVSGWFSSPSVWGGTYLTRSMGSVDVALEKRFFQDRLSLRLAGSDIFFTSFWRADATFGEVSFVGSGGYESQLVKFNLTYNFGNRDVKKIRDRKTGLEDEDRRTGGGQ